MTAVPWAGVGRVWSVEVSPISASVSLARTSSAVVPVALTRQEVVAGDRIRGEGRGGQQADEQGAQQDGDGDVGSYGQGTSIATVLCRSRQPR